MFLKMTCTATLRMCVLKNLHQRTKPHILTLNGETPSFEILSQNPKPKLPNPEPSALQPSYVAPGKAFFDMLTGFQPCSVVLAMRVAKTLSPRPYMIHSSFHFFFIACLDPIRRKQVEELAEKGRCRAWRWAGQLG